MEFVESVDLSMFLRAKIKTTDIFLKHYTKWSFGDNVNYWEDKIKNAGLT